MTYFNIAFIAWNIIVMAVYGSDKLKAVKKGRRVSEKALLLMAFFAGGSGALFGMLAFRHKTRHLRFQVLVPLFALLNMVLFVYLNSTVK